jgi:hypothetical protein
VNTGRPLQPCLKVIGIVGTDIGPRPRRTPVIAPVIAARPAPARHRDVSSGRRVNAQRSTGPALEIGLGLGPYPLLGAQLPGGDATGNVRVIDVAADQPVPPGEQHALTCPHRDLGDRRGSEDQPADQDRKHGLRCHRPGPLIQIESGDKLGVAHGSILPGAADILGTTAAGQGTRQVCR